MDHPSRYLRQAIEAFAAGRHYDVLALLDTQAGLWFNDDRTDHFGHLGYANAVAAWQRRFQLVSIDVAEVVDQSTHLAVAHGTATLQPLSGGDHVRVLFRVNVDVHGGCITDVHLWIEESTAVSELPQGRET